MANISHALDLYGNSIAISVLSVKTTLTFLNIDFSGNAGDSLTYHNGMKFSTKDRDNDRDSGNCAVHWKSALWYDNCHYSNLNGQYLRASDKSPGGVTWYNWSRRWKSMKKAAMKIRPVEF